MVDSLVLVRVGLFFSQMVRRNTEMKLTGNRSRGSFRASQELNPSLR